MSHMFVFMQLFVNQPATLSHKQSHLTHIFWFLKDLFEFCGYDDGRVSLKNFDAETLR